MSDAPLLDVQDLCTTFPVGSGLVPAVDGIDLTVRSGESVGLVGESGSGKTVAALSILRLIDPPGRIARGRVRFKGRDLLSLPEAALRRVRGGEIGLVFQEPASALNPVLTVGQHIAETLGAHGRATGRAARARAVDLLRSVKVPDPDRRVDEYPHQLSGGLRQRALMAMALACGPDLLVADEPTTALDATIQAQVLDLLRDLRSRDGLALILITHDLGAVAETTDRVAVMYAGGIVEEGRTPDVLRAPGHPYTRGLLASIPGGPPRSRLRTIEGSAPTPGTPAPGCAFAPRCPDRLDACAQLRPPMFAAAPSHRVRCHLHAPGPVPGVSPDEGIAR